MKKVLITGVDSYIGTSFEKYIKANYSETYIVDTVDMIGESWREKDFSGYDCVFHVAGIAHSDNGNISQERAKYYYAINTALAIETAQKAKREGVAQFIFMSSVIVYGESTPIGKSRIISRATEVAPANCYGDSKLQAEKGILPLGSDSFHVVILRPPMIYGKGSRGNYPVLSKIARTLPVFPAVDNCRSMLYVENLCEFVHLMIQNRESGIFFPQNSEYSNTSELVRLIAVQHGRKILLIKGLTWVLKLLRPFTGLVDKAFGSMCYDQSMSKYKEDYRKISLEESIRRTEG